MQGKWTIRALVAAAAIAGLSVSTGVMADPGHDSDRRHHQKHYPHQSAPGWYRSRPTPFSIDRRSDRHYRVYPRANPGHRYWRHRDYRPYRYYPEHRRHRVEYRHDHYHRHRPLLEIRAGFDRYTHCPGHGGYFFNDDIFYH